MGEYKIDFSTLPWQDAAPGARFKTYLEGDRRISLIEYTRAYTDTDWCTRGHIGFVQQGDCEMDFSGRLVRFSTGDGIFIPAGAANRHHFKALSDIVTLVLVGDA